MKRKTSNSHRNRKQKMSPTKRDRGYVSANLHRKVTGKKTSDGVTLNVPGTNGGCSPVTKCLRLSPVFSSKMFRSGAQGLAGSSSASSATSRHLCTPLLKADTAAAICIFGLWTVWSGAGGR